MKSIARPRISKLSTTTKLLLGLTLFYFIGKALGNR